MTARSVIGSIEPAMAEPVLQGDTGYTLYYHRLYTNKSGRVPVAVVGKGRGNCVRCM